MSYVVSAVQGSLTRFSQTKTVLVQNEPFELVVTLRNPYVFDLELQSLQLRFVAKRVQDHFVC